ncbi:MAG: diaminopimelate decarboxylase [Crenarchaeota archaeon]|nr:diaminopimelate decarboxylase [Thermoproteota archaeon]
MYKINSPLESKNDELFIDGVSTKKLAEKYDTPLYVISENRIRDNYRRLNEALTRNYSKVKIYFAMKSNSNQQVLNILETEGANIDAVSPGEVVLALDSGFTTDRILFTGTSVRNDELKFLCEEKVTINIDSLSELSRLLKISIPKIISFRINPEIGAGHHDHCITAGKETKFGIWEQDVIKAYTMAKEAGVKKFGIHMHIGSGILDTQPYLGAIDKLLNIAKKIHDQLGINFEFIDIGGGLGVPYSPEDKEIDLEQSIEEILSLFKTKITQYELGEPYFYIEPGRFIVCDTSILLTRVNTIKTTPYKKFIGVDAGFNTLLRPTMYGSYHHIVVANKMQQPDVERVDVAGPICETGDLLAKNRNLPKIEEGDLLAILNVGAYGFAMSSQYNTRPRPAEILVKDGKYKVIREQEQISELTVNQKTSTEWKQQ